MPPRIWHDCNYTVIFFILFKKKKERKKIRATSEKVQNDIFLNAMINI